MAAGYTPNVEEPNVDVVNVPVADAERARVFYVEVLGYRVLGDREANPEIHSMHLEGPPGAPAIVLSTWIEDMVPGSLANEFIDVDDIDAERERLAQQGVEVASEAIDGEAGRLCTFSDPDGNRWTLREQPFAS